MLGTTLRPHRVLLPVSGLQDPIGGVSEVRDFAISIPPPWSRRIPVRDYSDDRRTRLFDDALVWEGARAKPDGADACAVLPGRRRKPRRGPDAWSSTASARLYSSGRKPAFQTVTTIRSRRAGLPYRPESEARADRADLGLGPLTFSRSPIRGRRGHPWKCCYVEPAAIISLKALFDPCHPGSTGSVTRAREPRRHHRGSTFRSDLEECVPPGWTLSVHRPGMAMARPFEQALPGHSKCVLLHLRPVQPSGRGHGSWALSWRRPDRSESQPSSE